MRKKLRRSRDFIQNITIVLLSASAVFLLSQTQFFQLGANFSREFLGLDGSATQSATIVLPQTALSAPVRVSVTGEYGQYGSVTTVSDDELFLPLHHLLGEALNSAQEFTSCSNYLFLHSLDAATSVYYDFLHPLPLSVLSTMVESSCSETFPARHFLIAPEDNTVYLLLWDGADGYYRCATSIDPERLQETVGLFELGHASFAADKEYRYCESLSPCSLFPEPLPQLLQLSSTAATDSNHLLTTLEFNPRTNARYMESDGTTVVVEGERSVRFYPDGSILYRNGGDEVLQLHTTEEVPTAQEAFSEVSTLLNTLVSPLSGEGRLYLQSVNQSGSITMLTYGYHINGIPLHFTDDTPAAEVRLSGAMISSLSLQLRQYAYTETPSLLLPQQQAIAIAAQKDGAELYLGYVDNGTTVAGRWLID